LVHFELKINHFSVKISDIFNEQICEILKFLSLISTIQA